jgi:hypothetical protein
MAKMAAGEWPKTVGIFEKRKICNCQIIEMSGHMMFLFRILALRIVLEITTSFVLLDCKMPFDTSLNAKHKLWDS